MSHVLALAAVLAGLAHAGDLPHDRLIVLDRSIGPVRLGETRTAVTRALGPGKPAGRGTVTYFGGRLLVSYWFHDAPARSVTYVKTTWPGFHTSSGVHVGTLRRGPCSNGICTLSAGKGADAPGTSAGVHGGRVVWIAVGYG